LQEINSRTFHIFSDIACCLGVAANKIYRGKQKQGDQSFHYFLECGDKDRIKVGPENGLMNVFFGKQKTTKIILMIEVTTTIILNTHLLAPVNPKDIPTKQRKYNISSK
jgi:hypothetical protein